jgi:hypothetical protein
MFHVKHFFICYTLIAEMNCFKKEALPQGGYYEKIIISSFSNCVFVCGGGVCGAGN